MRVAAGLAPVPWSSRGLLLEGSDLTGRETEVQRDCFPQILTSFGADLAQNKDEADQAVLIPGCTEETHGMEREIIRLLAWESREVLWRNRGSGGQPPSLAAGDDGHVDLSGQRGEDVPQL